MKRDLIAVKSFPYAGKRLRAGAEFSAGESDARLLVAIGHAKYNTRVMTADVSYQTKVIRPDGKTLRLPETKRRTVQ